MNDSAGIANQTKPAQFFCAGGREFGVGRVGLEPTRCHHRRILSPLRLPVPPPPHGLIILYPIISTRQAFPI